MKQILILALSIAFLISCSTEVVKETDESTANSEIKPNEAEKEPVDKNYLFESDDEGVKEFMRCTKKVDGSTEWVYFTAKNPNEVQLGSREEAGFEVVYFLNKPKELYWVYGSECGYTLSDETRRKSQWYGQVQPKCADDMF